MCHYEAHRHTQKTATARTIGGNKVCASVQAQTDLAIRFNWCALGASSINTTIHWAPILINRSLVHYEQSRGGEQFITSSITATIIVCTVDSFVLLVLGADCIDKTVRFQLSEFVHQWNEINGQVKVSTLSFATLLRHLFTISSTNLHS